MSKVGEATGGYGRFFGGIGRRELLDQRWLYAHFHPDGGATIANYGFFTLKTFRGVHIDAAGELAFLTFAIPRDFHVLDECILLYVNHNVGMSSVTFMVNSRNCNEDLLAGEEGGAYDLMEFGANTMRCFDLRGVVGLVALAADDLFALSAHFGGDTDADVTLFGIIFKYH
ncbi:hypothetical protein MUO83_09215 [Candidatus Bathyarchaeota archaeon]|nr:hypothetical protein [Candidatus Bathyarchaeota archaeon]